MTIEFYVHYAPNLGGAAAVAKKRVINLPMGYDRRCYLGNPEDTRMECGCIPSYTSHTSEYVAGVEVREYRTFDDCCPKHQREISRLRERGLVE